MPRLQTQPDELADLEEASTRQFELVARRLTRAIFNGNQSEHELALNSLATLFERTMTLSDLLGRRRLIMQAKAVAEDGGLDLEDPFGAPIMFRLDAEDTIANVVNPTRFKEQIDDLVNRTPELAEPVGGEPRYLAIQRLYRDRHGFGLAKSFDQKLTERVQAIIQGSFDRGTPVKESIELIEKAGPFTRSYSEMVYRTNLKTTYTAGTFQQLKDPRMQLVFGALQFHARVDSDTRRGRKEDGGENHLALHGTIAPITSSIWDGISPPLGYNCRCSVFPVDRFKLQDMGLIGKNGQVKEKLSADFHKARPHSGFGQRPNARVYG